MKQTGSQPRAQPAPSRVAQEGGAFFGDTRPRENPKIERSVGPRPPCTVVGETTGTGPPRSPETLEGQREPRPERILLLFPSPRGVISEAIRLPTPFSHTAEPCGCPRTDGVCGSPRACFMSHGQGSARACVGRRRKSSPCACGGGGAGVQAPRSPSGRNKALCLSPAWGPLILVIFPK